MRRSERGEEENRLVWNAILILAVSLLLLGTCKDNRSQYEIENDSSQPGFP